MAVKPRYKHLLASTRDVYSHGKTSVISEISNKPSYIQRDAKARLGVKSVPTRTALNNEDVRSDVEEAEQRIPRLEVPDEDEISCNE